jgi:hypothetical protein
VNVIFIGRRAQGKSTLALYVAERVQGKIGAHIIPIFDPKRTFKCVPHTNNADVFGQMLLTPGPRAIAYQPFASTGDMEQKDNVWDEFSVFCDSLGIEKHLGDESPSRPDLGPVVLLVDEAWFLQSGVVVHPWLEKLVRLADYKTFFLFQMAHRPGDISPRVRAQADEFFYFRQWLPGDIDIVEDMSGADVAEAVSQLPDHHVIRFEVATGFWELWANPANWYRDISAECVKGEYDGNANIDASRESGKDSPDRAIRGSDEGATGEHERAPQGYAGV